VLSDGVISVLQPEGHRFRARLLMLQVAQVQHAAAAEHGERATDGKQNESPDDDAFVFPRKYR
jgi:hypothetical protein